MYRKLLVCHEVVYDGKSANCITNETGILTVSSELHPKAGQARHQSHQPILLEPDEFDFDYHVAINEEIEKFDEHLNSYAASKIEDKIKKSIQIRNAACKECYQVFQKNEKICDSFLSRKISINQPCKSTVDIIKIFNKIHDLLPLEREYHSKAIARIVLNHLSYEDLFTATEFEEHIYEQNEQSQMSHKEYFIFQIVNTYINIRSHNIYKKQSEEERGNYVRHKYTKQIHLAGQ